MSELVAENLRIPKALLCPKDGDIEKLRRKTIGGTTQVIERITGGTLSRELQDCKIMKLRPFFQQHPTAWSDLKRKLHKYIGYNSETTTYEIGDNGEVDILSIFLQKSRTQDTGETIKKYVDKEVFNNQTLLANVFRNVAERSILDMPFSEAEKLSSEAIYRLLLRGIQQNNLKLKSDIEAEKELKDITPEVIEYLKRIFGFNKISGVKIDPVRIGKKIYKLIWDGGIAGEEALGFIKAIFAWGGIKEIIKTHEEAEDSMEHFGDKFNKLDGVKYTGLPYPDSSGIYRGNLRILLSSGKEVDLEIETRIKSIESILLKLWSSEEYTTVDALRDIIGSAIVFGSNVTNDDKIEIMGRLTEVMSDYGYLFKNKELLDQEGIESVDKIIQKRGTKRPLAYSGKTKGRTSIGFINASISGFTSVKKGSSAGFEIQFFDEEGYSFWKEDHIRLDIEKEFEALSRGLRPLTLNRVFIILRRRIPGYYLEDNGVTLGGMVADFIEKGTLIPFITHEDHENTEDTNKILLFTYKGKNQDFQTEFPTMRPVKVQTEIHRNLVKTILDGDFGIATPSSSSQLPLLGQ